MSGAVALGPLDAVDGPLDDLLAWSSAACTRGGWPMVARKTWIRGLWACLTASQARSMSLSLQRARPQTIEPVTSAAMACTASKSPGEAIGKPASMMSTPSSARARATSSFSARFMLAPGDCSPSRRSCRRCEPGWGRRPGRPPRARARCSWLGSFLVGWVQSTDPNSAESGGLHPPYDETKKPRDPPVEAGLGASLSAGRHGPDEP